MLCKRNSQSGDSSAGQYYPYPLKKGGDRFTLKRKAQNKFGKKSVQSFHAKCRSQIF